MSFAHLCIDMQALEGKKFSSPADWHELAQTITGFKSELQECQVPTINVALVEYTPRNTNLSPVLGRFSKVRDEMLYRHQIDLTDKADLGFNTPPADDDWVAIKRRFPAYMPPIKWFLEFKKVHTVILTGVWESDCEMGIFRDSFCLTRTAFDYRKHGYNVIIAKDGTNFMHDGRVSDADLAKRSRYYKAHSMLDMPIREIIELAKNQNATPNYV